MATNPAAENEKVQKWGELKTAEQRYAKHVQNKTQLVFPDLSYEWYPEAIKFSIDKSTYTKTDFIKPT